MYVATASPWPKRTAFDGSRGGECALCSPPLDPPLITEIFYDKFDQ